MSWTINLSGTTKWKLLSSDWIAVDSSAFGAYTSGLYFTKLGSTTAVAITSATPGVTTTLTKVTHGLVAGDYVIISGTGVPSAWTALTTQPYYQVEYVNANDFKIKKANTTLSTVSFDAYGCQPHLVDESEEINYWAGGYRKLKKARIGFTIPILPFTTKGNWNTNSQGHKNYWDLEKVLYSRSLYLMNFGSDFERLFNLLGVYTTDFKLPLQVEVFDFGNLSAEFENNQDKLEITLVSTEWFTFS